MTGYEKLIETLRRCGGSCAGCEYEETIGCVSILHEKAANAIAELFPCAIGETLYTYDVWGDIYEDTLVMIQKDGNGIIYILCHHGMTSKSDFEKYFFRTEEEAIAAYERGIKQ